MSTYAKIGTLVADDTSGTSTVFTTNTIVNVGDLVVIRYGNDQAARPTGLACTDNTGGSTNTFAIAKDGSNGSVCYAAIFWCVATSSIPSGGHITVSTTAAAAFRGLDGIKCTNPAGSTPLDSGPTKFSFGSGTAAISGTTAAPATSDWVGVCVIDYATAVSVAPQAGWTEDNDNGTVFFESQTIIGTNTTAMRGAGTLNTSGGWVCVAAVFKLSSPSTPLTLTASVSTTASVTRSAAKGIVASAATTGSLVRRAQRTLSATSATSVTTSASKAFLRTLTATYAAASFGISISFQVLPGRNMSATSTTTAALKTGGVISLAASAPTSATLAKAIARRLSTGVASLVSFLSGGNRTLRLAAVISSVATAFAVKAQSFPQSIAQFSSSGGPSVQSSAGGAPNQMTSGGGAPEL